MTRSHLQMESYSLGMLSSGCVVCDFNWQLNAAVWQRRSFFYPDLCHEIFIIFRSFLDSKDWPTPRAHQPGGCTACRSHPSASDWRFCSDFLKYF